MFDGVSVVIRRSIMRLMSPDHLRGRIASVSMIFIGSSNELGALESGVAAAWLGTERSVWMGGCVTLLVVARAYVLGPKTAHALARPQPGRDDELPEPSKKSCRRKAIEAGGARSSSWRTSVSRSSFALRTAATAALGN